MAQRPPAVPITSVSPNPQIFAGFWACFLLGRSFFFGVVLLLEPRLGFAAQSRRVLWQVSGKEPGGSRFYGEEMKWLKG